MNTVKLGKRLTAAAEFCRKGSFIADVGTDHGYLPIYLIQKGIIKGGVASDINKGPIERARANITEHGVRDKIDTVRCDGLSLLEKYAPDDIFILGMGGELIATIIDNAPFTKKEGVRLVLQPMTHPEILRAFLLEKGYEIVGERLVKEEKIYQIIAAEYTGKIENYSEIELLFGRLNIKNKDPLVSELALHTKMVMTERIKGKSLGGADVSRELALIEELGGLI